MGERLAGKVALVTGGGGGIGEATARLFWEEGAHVALVDNDASAAQQAAHAIDPSGERVLAVGADLTKEGLAQHAVYETVARFGGLDVLANVAGVRVWGPITVRRRAASKGISLEEAEREMRAAGSTGPLLKRQAAPREIAYGILYLACDESSYVTGTTLMVDGGLSV